jgi:hypothetical protein
MKNGLKAIGIVLILLAVGLLFSCVTQGQFKPASASDDAAVVGTVSASFTTSSISKEAVNSQAYIALMAEAQKTYSGNIDIRDITWVVGQSDGQNREYAAIGKVIRTGPEN